MTKGIMFWEGISLFRGLKSLEGLIQLQRSGTWIALELFKSFGAFCASGLVAGFRLFGLCAQLAQCQALYHASEARVSTFMSFFATKKVHPCVVRSHEIAPLRFRV